VGPDQLISRTLASNMSCAISSVVGHMQMFDIEQSLNLVTVFRSITPDTIRRLQASC